MGAGGATAATAEAVGGATFGSALGLLGILALILSMSGDSSHARDNAQNAQAAQNAGVQPQAETAPNDPCKILGCDEPPGAVNLGNLKKLGDKQYEQRMGESAHQLKREILGSNANIAKFDIACSTEGWLYLVSKNGKVVIETGVRWIP